MISFRHPGTDQNPETQVPVRIDIPRLRAVARLLCGARETADVLLVLTLEFAANHLTGVANDAELERRIVAMLVAIDDEKVLSRGAPPEPSSSAGHEVVSGANAFRQLTPSERLAILLVDVLKHDIRQVAPSMAHDVSSLHRHLSQARMKFRSNRR
jgi:hypothetical protein